MSYLVLVLFFLEVFCTSFQKLKLLHLFHQLACYENKLKNKRNDDLSWLHWRHIVIDWWPDAIFHPLVININNLLLDISWAKIACWDFSLSQWFLWKVFHCQLVSQVSILQQHSKLINPNLHHKRVMCTTRDLFMMQKDTFPQISPHIWNQGIQKKQVICVFWKASFPALWTWLRRYKWWKTFTYKQGDQVVATFIELAAWSYFKLLQCSTNHYYVKINVIKSRN